MARENKGKKIFFISSATFLCLFLLTVVVLVKYANVIARGGIEKALGEDFSVDAIELRWGSVEVVGITMKDRAGKEVIKIGELVVKANFMSFLRKQYIISSITVKDPYIYVETGRSGNIVSPVLPWRGTTTKKKEDDRSEKAGGGNPVAFKKVAVVNGAVDYYDRKSPKTPVLTKFREINLEMHDLTVPFTEDLTRYAVTAVIEGPRGHATLKNQGNIRFANRDMDFTGSLRNLDITHFKPYYQQAGNANIERGILDVDLRGNENH